MGIWNSHTSVGNILGSLIAGVWVSSAWGLSFIVPGVIIAAVGIICFFFLVECEWPDRRGRSFSPYPSPSIFGNPKHFFPAGGKQGRGADHHASFGVIQAGSAPAPLASLIPSF